jgi:hypothetical protein
MCANFLGEDEPRLVRKDGTVHPNNFNGIKAPVEFHDSCHRPVDNCLPLRLPTPLQNHRL